MRRIIGVLVSVTALLLSIGGAGAHAAPPPSGGTVVTSPNNVEPRSYTGKFINWDHEADGSSICAGLYGGSTADNVGFTAYKCGTTGFADTWYLNLNFCGSNGCWYQLKNAYSLKCAMPINYSKTVGDYIVQSTCAPYASSSSACNNACSVQLWRFEDPSNSPGYYPSGAQYLYNRYSNQCLNIKQGILVDGTPIAQTNCGSSHLSDIWIYTGL